MSSVIVNGKSFEPYIAKEELQVLIADLGKRISEDYAEKNPLLISVLNGSFIFAADLVRHISCPMEITFVKVASYEATESKGSVEEILGLDKDIMDRHIIIVEDIVDTGLTIQELTKTLKTYLPASIEVASMLYKPATMKADIEVKYIAKEIPPVFVLGYGLDYDGQGRNLADLYQLAE